MKDKEDEIWEDIVMRTDVYVLREKGYIVFEKEDQLWMYISSTDDLTAWGKLNGFDSIDELEDKSWFSIDEIVGQTICLSNGSIEFAKDRDWWDTIDQDRVDAVLNDMQFGWALSGAFLAFMGEAEFGINVIEQIGKVSGGKVTDSLSSEFMNEEWHPASDTTGFLEGVVDFLSTEFNFKLESKKDSDIQYFS